MASFWYPSSWNFGVHPLATAREIADAQSITAWNSSMQDEETAAKIAEAASDSSAVPQDALAILLPHPVNQDPLTFGKYKGKTPLEIATFDPGYILWCAGKGITTGDEKLVAHCQQVVDRAGPKQAQGHLKYGPRR